MSEEQWIVADVDKMFGLFDSKEAATRWAKETGHTYSYNHIAPVVAPKPPVAEYVPEIGDDVWFEWGGRDTEGNVAWVDGLICTVRGGGCTFEISAIKLHRGRVPEWRLRMARGLSW